MKISWEQADVITKFPQVSLLLFFLISRLWVNMLVKGSLLIRVLNGLTSPNPIQFNSILLIQFVRHMVICSASGLCHYLLNIQPLSLWWGEKSALLLLSAWLTGPSLYRGAIILHTNMPDTPVDLFVLHLHKSQGLLEKTFKGMIRWDGMVKSICVCIFPLSICVCSLYVWKEWIWGRKYHQNGPFWQTAAVGTVAPSNDSRTEAETGRCFGSLWICIQNAALARPGLYGKSS